MNKEQAASLIQAQRDFFLSGATRDVEFRISFLEKLGEVFKRREADMYRAVRDDMGRAELETFFMEVFSNQEELEYALRNIHDWTQPRREKTPTLFFRSQSRIHPEPFGVALIISAWNFPLLQLFSPLIGAVAAGNTAILKPASDAPACSRIAAEITAEVFPPEYVTCVDGPSANTTLLLDEKLDYIFFTGSPRVGRIVQQAASKNLTPVTLELGGKSPAIVDETADIDLAARRIAWCKLFNAGQICVTADHVYVQRSVKDEFIARAIEHIHAFYGDDPSQSPDFGFIINERNFDRLVKYLDSGKVVHGGGHDRARRYLEPTILDEVDEASPIMREEIFGPIMPVLAFDELEEVIVRQQRKDKPLALYFFSTDKRRQQRIIERTSSGGVTINDCMSHGGSVRLPFGGVGNSGMGAYHGKFTFDTFTHYKAVMTAPTGRLLDLPLKYPPYAGKLEKVKRLERFL